MANAPRTSVPALLGCSAGEGDCPAVHVHQHHHQPRPVSVADDAGAAALFGWAHKRTTYRALGVACAELPGGRFAVLVSDVEKALRERGTTTTSANTIAVKVTTEADDDRALLERSGLKLAGGSRR